MGFKGKWDVKQIWLSSSFGQTVYLSLVLSLLDFAELVNDNDLAVQNHVEYSDYCQAQSKPQLQL